MSKDLPELIAYVSTAFFSSQGGIRMEHTAMERQAFSLSPSTPEQLAAFVKEQMESYRRTLEAAGVQPE